MGFKEDIDNYYINAIISFTLFNTVQSTFNGYMGGKLIRLIKNNDYLRTFFLFIVLWFTINNILKTDETLSFWESVVLALLVGVFILIFSRQPLYYNIVESLIILTIYTINLEKDNFSSVITDRLNLAINILYFIIAGIMLIGFFKYYLIKKSEKGNRFSLEKFFIGKRESKI